MKNSSMISMKYKELGNISVIVTSVIYFKDKKLSYSDKRSTFNPEERLDQTKKTISSIREKIPQAKIYLFEQGTKDVSNQISPLVDYYKYIGGNKIVRTTTDSPFKGVGEIIGLLFVSNSLTKETNTIFKISGRYYLNENFDLDNWKNGIFIARKYGPLISTRLYSFNEKFLNMWRICLILSIPLTLLNISIEKIMPILIPKKIIKGVECLGISGLVGINGETIDE